MPLLGGIEVNLVSHGYGTLQEFPIPATSLTSTTMYTLLPPSTHSRLFHLAFNPHVFICDNPDVPYFKLWARIDGVLHTSNSALGTLGYVSTCIPTKIHGFCKRGSGGFVGHPFVFQDLEVTEADGRAVVPLEGVGELRIMFGRCMRKKSGDAVDAAAIGGSRVTEGASMVETVNEKQIKGKDVRHVVGLGQAGRARPGMIMEELRCLDTPETPFLEFVFRYRTKHALRVLGVMPKYGNNYPVISPESISTSLDVPEGSNTTMIDLCSSPENDLRGTGRTSPISDHSQAPMSAESPQIKRERTSELDLERLSRSQLLEIVRTSNHYPRKRTRMIAVAVVIPVKKVKRENGLFDHDNNPDYVAPRGS